MLNRAVIYLAERLKRWIPDAFVFALILTILIAALSWILTDSTFIEVLEAWYRGFWMLLSFSMQVLLMLVTSFAIALSTPVSRFLDQVANRIKSPGQVYLVVMVVGTLFALVSWG